MIIEVDGLLIDTDAVVLAMRTTDRAGSPVVEIHLRHVAGSPRQILDVDGAIFEALCEAMVPPEPDPRKPLF